MTPEAKVKKAIKAILAKYKIYYIMPAPGLFGASVGTADFICCVCGYFVAIEAKAANGTESKMQEIKRKEVMDSGGMAFIVTPDRLPALEQTIRTIIKRSMMAMQAAVQPDPEPKTEEKPIGLQECKHGTPFAYACEECDKDDENTLCDHGIPITQPCADCPPPQVFV